MNRKAVVSVCVLSLVLLIASAITQTKDLPLSQNLAIPFGISSAYGVQENATAKFVIPATFGSGSSNGQFQSPVAIAVDKTGDIYVVDSQTAHIQKFSSSGKFLSTFGGLGSGNGLFNYPYGIALDGSGNIFVQDNLNAKIQKFDSSGKFVTQFGSYGTGSGQFKSLSGIAIDSTGNIYVLDSGNSDVQKFDNNGKWITSFGSAGSNKFDPLGSSTAAKFDAPRGIAVDKSGHVYVADTGNSRVQKFDSSGNYILSFGSPGTLPGQFDSPNSVAADSLGNVYVLDSGNDRIERFDSSGKFITAYGSLGYQGQGGKFFAPTGIAADDSGNVYVADTGNYRVQVLSFVNANVTPEFPITVLGAMASIVGVVIFLGRVYKKA